MMFVEYELMLKIIFYVWINEKINEVIDFKLII